MSRLRRVPPGRRALPLPDGWMNALLVLVGFAVLIAAGDALVRGAVALGLRLGVPAAVVSATVVAFGTSAPELLISVRAALEDAPGIALGNVVGSNIANVLLVLGVPALIAPLAGCGTETHRGALAMLGATAIFAALVSSGAISAAGGALLLAVALGMVVDSIRCGLRRPGRGAAGSGTREAASWKPLALLAVGLAGLPLGAGMLVHGAQGVARDFGVSEALIGLTVVAVGTSLPELATTVAAALRNRADVAVGNVIGSNLFNLTAVIGTAAIVHPLRIPAEIAERDIWAMIGATAILTPFVFFRLAIPRPVGAAFTAAYAGYVFLAYART